MGTSSDNDDSVPEILLVKLAELFKPNVSCLTTLFPPHDTSLSAIGRICTLQDEPLFASISYSNEGHAVIISITPFSTHRYQLLILFNAGIYDRSQDRRSKAYFQRKLAQGVQEALQSDHPDNVLDLLKKSAEGDDEVAQSFQNALQLAGADQGFSPSSVLMPELSRTSTADTLAWSQRVNDAKSNSHVCHSFCGVGFPGHKNVDWYPSEARERQERRLQGPQHLILPHTIDDQSPLSLTYTNFIQGAQHMLGQGATLESILGPLDAEVDLLFRPREQPDHFSASTWACEVVRLASPIDLVTQLATVFLLARFMRWTLDPSQENFAHLPTLVKPTPYQQRIPHYASADLFPLPATRDCLIRGELRLPTAVESGGEGAGIKFTWPFDLSQAVERDPHTGVTKVSRLLAELASDASNWSSSRDFLERTPVAEGFLRVVDHQHDWAPMEAFFSE